MYVHAAVYVSKVSLFHSPCHALPCLAMSCVDGLACNASSKSIGRAMDLEAYIRSFEREVALETGNDPIRRGETESEGDTGGNSPSMGRAETTSFSPGGDGDGLESYLQPKGLTNIESLVDEFRKGLSLDAIQRDTVLPEVASSLKSHTLAPLYQCQQCKVKSEAVLAAGNWILLVDNDTGEFYVHNVKTGKSLWRLPPDGGGLSQLQVGAFQSILQHRETMRSLTASFRELQKLKDGFAQDKERNIMHAGLSPSLWGSPNNN